MCWEDDDFDGDLDDEFGDDEDEPDFREEFDTGEFDAEDEEDLEPVPEEEDESDI